MAKIKNDIIFDYKARTKDLERGNRRVSKSLGGLRSGAARLGGLFAAAYGAREVLQFGKDAIQASSDYTESINAVEVATGSAAGQILKLGDDSATAFGISKTEVNEAAVAFAGFADQIDASDVGGTFEDLLARASDFASVYNLEVSEALQVFQSTLAGQSKPIRAFGKDTSDAAIKAFALANGIGEVGREMTEGEKVQARYGLLMEITANTQGDFANTSEELAGQLRITNAELENAKIALGDELIPLQVQWVKLQRTALIPLLKQQAGGIGELVDSYTDLSDAVGKLLARDLGQFFKDSESTARGLGEVMTRLNPIVGATDFAFQKLGFGTIGVSGAFKDMIGPARNVAEVIGGRPFAEAAKDIEAMQPALTDTNRLLEIFSGDLFAAARNARDLAEATANIDLLFAGGGGSGEVADAQNNADLSNLNTRTGGLQ